MMDKAAKAKVEPVRQRTQYSCMAASMAMCLRALDYDTTEDLVNRVMGAQPMKGAAWEQALACAQHFGCRATLTMPCTVEQLKKWTDAGIPVMIAWNPEGRPWSHASVVFHVDEDLNVHVADPNIPNPKETVRIVPEAEFYGKWYEKFPDYLVRRPACAIEREITEEGKQVRMASTKESKGPSTAPKTQKEKDEAKNKIVVEQSKARNDAARALAEKGNKGQGVHKNKQDYDRGRARKPKHPGREREATADGIWNRKSFGLTFFDGEIAASLRLEDKTDYVQDRNIPDVDDVADPELNADGIPEYMQSYKARVAEWEKWMAQGWWPRPVQSKAFHLVIGHWQTKRGFEAWFPRSEFTKAKTLGERAIEIIRGRKYPRWMTPMPFQSSSDMRRWSAYEGNPDGEPIYDVKVNHGENQALSGGHDIMKRVQDKLRIEQGNPPREPNPRLGAEARLNANISVERVASRYLDRMGKNDA